MSPQAICSHSTAAARAKRYILGGQDLTLQQILTEIAGLVGRKPPTIRLPTGVVLPIAYVAEAFARLTGRPGRITVESVRMARKHMFFSSEKGETRTGIRVASPHGGAE